MSTFFQRSRRYIESVVGVGEKLRFDVPLNHSESLPHPENLSNPGTPEPDFDYHDDGRIDLYRASTYIVAWQVATLTGHATTGQCFELRKRDYDVADENAPGAWVAVGEAAAAQLVSPSHGNTLLLVGMEEISTYGKATVALFNTADAPVKLSHHPHSKAGILLFGIGPVDSDITNLYTYVQDLYAFIEYSDVYIYRANQYPFYYPTSGTADNPSPGTLITLNPGDPNSSPEPRHFQIGVIWSGYTYNFWLISPAPPRGGGFSLANNRDYLLLAATDFVIGTDSSGNPICPLTWYQGQETYGSMWLDLGNGYDIIPIILDSTGIRLRTGRQINGVMNAKFTQTLILSPPMSAMSGSRA